MVFFWKYKLGLAALILVSFLACKKGRLDTGGLSLAIYYMTDPAYYELQTVGKYVEIPTYGLSGLFVQRTGTNACVAYDLRSPNLYHPSVQNPPCNTRLRPNNGFVQDACLNPPVQYSIATGLFFGVNTVQAADSLTHYNCFVDTINEMIYIP